MERDHLQPDGTVPREQPADLPDREGESVEGVPAGIERQQTAAGPSEPEETVRHEDFEGEDAA